MEIVDIMNTDYIHFSQVSIVLDPMEFSQIAYTCNYFTFWCHVHVVRKTKNNKSEIAKMRGKKQCE